MNKLKPEDVMRALELCKSFRDLHACDVCPYFRAELGDDESCTNRMAQDALALLREKDAEIEKLETAFEKEYVRVEHLMRQLETARAEAITEFEKELTSELIRGGIYPVFVKGAIERTDKKLKGATDGKSDL